MTLCIRLHLRWKNMKMYTSFLLHCKDVLPQPVAWIVASKDILSTADTTLCLSGCLLFCGSLWKGFGLGVSFGVYCCLGWSVVPAAIHQRHPLCCFSCFCSVCVQAPSIAKTGGLQVRDCKNRCLLRNNHRLSAVVQIRPGLVSTNSALKLLLVITEGIIKTQCACGWVSSVSTRQLTRAPVHTPMTLL